VARTEQKLEQRRSIVNPSPFRCIALSIAAVLGLALLGAPARAVILDDEDLIDLVLSDGTTVRLYGEALATAPPVSPTGPRPNVVEMTRGAVAEPTPVPRSGEGRAASRAAAVVRLPLMLRTEALAAETVKRSGKYYYLPVNLHLSKRPDQTPEFLFLKFTTEAREDAGGASGAIVHFLMEWGLTAEQETDLRAKLQALRPGAQLMGAAPMEPAGETGTFQIVSATLSDSSMAKSVVTSGKAPLVPGGKAAAASRLSANGAQLLAASFEQARSITDVSVVLDMGYQTLTPAARGTITFNWEKLSAERQTIEAEYTATEEESVDWGCFLIFCAFWEEETYSYSYDELQEFYRFLEEKKVVELKFDELVDDDRVEKIREAFFDYFLQSMTDNVPPPPPQEAQSPFTVPDIQKGSRYQFNREIVQGAFERKNDTFSLQYRLSIRRPHQLVGNLGSWYDQVRDNPKCVASVNLNDPFFQHRDIKFILDLDAKEMFAEAVNYVTVNVRKRRDTGRPFEDHVTMDADYVTKNGITSSVTYARGEDKNPDLYEYQTQWSLKGGNVFPDNPPWARGSWEGVTLSPPVVPRTIEVEGNLDDMKASDITRITVQIHYPKFGAEAEENIHISPAQNQGLVSKKIFVDRGTRGYAYRLVVNHKTEGKFALPWSAQVGDDYIYTTIPPELLEEGSSLRAEAKAAAEDVLESAKEKVLDRFRDVIGGGNP
jgi:hypothetical protein